MRLAGFDGLWCALESEASMKTKPITLKQHEAIANAVGFQPDSARYLEVAKRFGVSVTTVCRIAGVNGLRKPQSCFNLRKA